MTYIYFDESGDLGFDFTKCGTSTKFSLAFLILNNKRQISSLVKKVFTSLPKAAKYKNSGVLHAYYEKAATIKKLLTGLAMKDVSIATIHLDKRKVPIANNPHELYANMVTALINRLCSDGIINGADGITLIASRCNTSKSLNARFSQNIINHALATKINVSIVKPFDDKCLQAVDFVSWAFWRKYEMSDSTYADILSEKVVMEYIWTSTL